MATKRKATEEADAKESDKRAKMNAAKDASDGKDASGDRKASESTHKPTGLSFFCVGSHLLLTLFFGG